MNTFISPFGPAHKHHGSKCIGVFFFSIKKVPPTPNSGNPQRRGETRHGFYWVFLRLSDDGAGGGGLVLPGRRKDTDGLVVTGQTVDTGLDENEAELGVLVLAVALEVLADGDSLVERLLETRVTVDCSGRAKAPTVWNCHIPS